MLLGRNRAWLELLREKLLPEAESLHDIAVIDLMKQGSLERAFEKIDILVSAISSAEPLPAVVRTAPDTKTECLDILACCAATRNGTSLLPCAPRSRNRDSATSPMETIIPARWPAGPLGGNPVPPRSAFRDQCLKYIPGK